MALVLVEYDAMMLGQQSLAVQHQTDPHFALLKEGITFTEVSFCHALADLASPFLRTLSVVMMVVGKFRDLHKPRCWP
jgi:hypothetical protein